MARRKPMLMFNGPLMVFAGISVFLGRKVWRYVCSHFVPSYLVALICSSYRRLSKHTGSEPPFLHSTLWHCMPITYLLAVLVGLLSVAQHH